MKKSVIRYAGLVIGLALVTAGALRHEPATLLIRAITICLECAGVG